MDQVDTDTRINGFLVQKKYLDDVQHHHVYNGIVIVHVDIVHAIHPVYSYHAKILQVSKVFNFTWRILHVQSLHRNKTI